MQYTRKDLGSYNLHLIKTNKYKTVTIKVCFHSPITKEDITKRNILTDILLQSSKEYSTKRDMIIKSENLYAIDVYNNNQRYGNYFMTSFIIQSLHDKYTEEGNLDEAIKFMSDIILNPDVDTKGFKEDKLSQVKSECEVALSTIKENPAKYSAMRLYEVYDSNNPISYRMTGYKEDLERITRENLYKYYKKMIDNDFVDIFVAGDFDEEKMISLIKKYFKFRKVKKKKAPYELTHRKLRRKNLIEKEKVVSSQSKLAIACPVGNLTTYEKNYPLVLANIIFGGGTDSKLFNYVREKKSLCYAIFSSLSKLDNMITIKAGIDKDNFESTVDAINKVLELMKKARFSEKDIKTAKEIYANAISTIEEDPLQIINEYLTEEIMKIEPYKERLEMMNKVTKKDIIKVLKKIKIDTIFLLEGDKE